MVCLNDSIWTLPNHVQSYDSFYQNGYKDDNNISFDGKRYRGTIGNLLYLESDRPDLMFSVCLYARYNVV